MPATQAIKSRIGSVKNTRQITKAMELVAASKLRRAQEAVRHTSEYATAARELLTYLRSLPETDDAALYQKRDVIKTKLYIVVSGDRGLAGAYNSNVMKQLIAKLRDDKAAGIAAQIITVGRLAGRFVARLQDVTTVGAYENLPDKPHNEQLQPIISTAVDAFLKGDIDAAEIIYTEYVSSVVQTAQSVPFLPAGFELAEGDTAVRQATFEPSVSAVLETVTMRLLESQLLQTLLAARASEYSMRMMAMHNATDNANGIIDDLTLEMNKARQAYITQELAEITGGAEALS